MRGFPWPTAADTAAADTADQAARGGFLPRRDRTVSDLTVSGALAPDRKHCDTAGEGHQIPILPVVLRINLDGFSGLRSGQRSVADGYRSEGRAIRRRDLRRRPRPGAHHGK